MPSSLTCNSRRRSLWRSPTVGSNGTARHVGWCTSASYLRQAVSRSSFRPRSVVRRCWSDSRTISRNSSSRRHVAAGVRPDQPARATLIRQRHRGTSRRTPRGGSAPQQAVTSLASATTARTNTARNRTSRLRGAACAAGPSASPGPPCCPFRCPPGPTAAITGPALLAETSLFARDFKRCPGWESNPQTLSRRRF